MEKVVVHKGSFVASDDKGRRHTIHVFQEIIHHAHGSIEGMATLKTHDGKHVNHKEKGKYVIAESGISLHSDDPNCP